MNELINGRKLELHVGDLSSRLAQYRETPYSGMRFGTGNNHATL